MQLLNKIATVFLSLILVVSTIGIVVNKHYCGDTLRDVAIQHQAEKCVGEMSMGEGTGCCEDTVEEYQVDEYNKLAFEYDSSAELFELGTVENILLDFDELWEVSSHIDYLNYKPPLIERDVPILVQSFLI